MMSGSDIDLKRMTKFNLAESKAWDAKLAVFHYRSFRGKDGKRWTCLPKDNRTAKFVETK